MRAAEQCFNNTCSYSMNQEQAIALLTNTIRRRHLALSTERTYRFWLVQFLRYICTVPSALHSEQKIEGWLTTLALKVDCYPANLVVRLIYGCGLRVSEPLNLRIRDIDFANSTLAIRGAKGNKDRVVALPCSLIVPMKAQIEAARHVWQRDRVSGLPLKLPDRIAQKYPAAQFSWQWAYLFPLRSPCPDPRNGRIVRYRMLECTVQRAVKRACEKLGIAIMPHELRHGYATHCLNRGENPRAIQQAMGHASLETTMGYCHAEATGVRSPLESLEVA